MTTSASVWERLVIEYQPWPWRSATARAARMACSLGRSAVGFRLVNFCSIDSLANENSAPEGRYGPRKSAKALRYSVVSIIGLAVKVVKRGGWPDCQGRFAIPTP